MTAAPPRLSSCAPSTLFTASSNFPPKLPISKQNLLPKHQNNQQSYRIEFEISRRDAFLLSFLTLAPSLALPDPANAFSIGISGPKDWLKEQKKKSSKFLLAPIDASRQILNSAYLLLMDKQSDYTNKDLEEVQKMFRSAARDCVPQERNSFVAFQANTGVEVCTFRLIVKNASSLLDNKDPAKLQAEAILDDLIRSFASLNGLAGDTAIELSSRREKLADALMDTISSLNKFEQGIKDCLELFDSVNQKPAPNTVDGMVFHHLGGFARTWVSSGAC